jgi:hypothetical protein
MTNQEVAASLAIELAPLGIVPIDQELANEPSIGSLRRRRLSRHEDEVGVLTLLDIDGVLVWEDGAVSPATSRYRRRRAGTAADGEVVVQLKYSKALGVNQIGEQLEKLDARLTPNGPAQLLEWDKQTWASRPIERPTPDGKILLLMHGTFSNSQNLVRELWGAQGEGIGAEFLRKVARTYTQVISFDHYTVSRSPLINAVELARRFQDARPELLDVVCHSRGGLVTRWWSEVLDVRNRARMRVVFVGCPLGGTSLADPTSLRGGLNLMSNVGRALGAGCTLIPMLTVAASLMQILTTATAFAARTPLVDAAVAMIPGLSAMSRIKNNHELNALNGLAVPTPAKYFAITSDFEPDPASWRFWRAFSGKNLANVAADQLVFKQANDLVVDTDSMTHHAWGATPDPLGNPEVFLCFGPADGVHHVNYFSNERAIEFVERSLGL